MIDQYAWCHTCGCALHCHSDVDDDTGTAGPCGACDMCPEFLPQGGDAD